MWRRPTRHPTMQKSQRSDYSGSGTRMPFREAYRNSQPQLISSGSVLTGTGIPLVKDVVLPDGVLIFYIQRARVVTMSIRMRHTSGHTGNRRSHHALKKMNIVKDAESGNLRLPHRIDEVTGMYRGKQIFQPPAGGGSASGGKAKKLKGPDTEPATPKHVHEHAHEVHANAEAKTSKGFLGKFFKGRARARSGFGGGV